MLEVTQNKGLTTAQAQKRLETFGLNKLPEPKQASLIEVFLSQFFSPFIYILIIAALISYFINQIPSAVFILLVLLINAIIGTVQEFSAQKSASALRDMVQGSATVLRDGKQCTIDTEQLVPDDVVFLASGDKIPADLELLTATDLKVDESMLTGESLAVTKNAHAKVAEDAPLAEQLNMCFAGSIAVHGRAMGLVVQTGTNTQIGHIADHVTQKRASEPPLMIRLKHFTYQVAGFVFAATFSPCGPWGKRQCSYSP